MKLKNNKKEVWSIYPHLYDLEKTGLALETWDTFLVAHSIYGVVKQINYFDKY